MTSGPWVPRGMEEAVELVAWVSTKGGSGGLTCELLWSGITTEIKELDNEEEVDTCVSLEADGEV